MSHFDAIREHQQTVERLLQLVPAIEAVGQAMTRCLRDGGKVLWMGNGGSAADSQHLAAELVGRFERERRGLASLALTTDSSVLTALGNDYGYELIFERQVEALCRPGDVLVGLSTSGNSPNVVAALQLGARLGAVTVGLSGRDGGRIAEVAVHCITVPSTRTARIQEAHILIGHLLCEQVETALAESPRV